MSKFKALFLGLFYLNLVNLYAVSDEAITEFSKRGFLNADKLDIKIIEKIPTKIDGLAITKNIVEIKSDGYSQFMPIFSSENFIFNKFYEANGTKFIDFQEQSTKELELEKRKEFLSSSKHKITLLSQNKNAIEKGDKLSFVVDSGCQVSAKEMSKLELYLENYSQIDIFFLPVHGKTYAQKNLFLLNKLSDFTLKDSQIPNQSKIKLINQIFSGVPLSLEDESNLEFQNEMLQTAKTLKSLKVRGVPTLIINADIKN
ncbi:hypothetical protein [Campylobacter geochelonis]|uniref:hypothetical protein n=1 Tax=Campylobacter geochelonis TaxID=1780362 RepID=UPI000770963C|nr:hypothetical protein [Campylobacter geochelonis]CZE48861.1 Uncharacterised protein [Campylobacter geochelonis]CZE50630.1 Uncharacterised protein [Campylobacter geochelonis]